MFCVRSVRYAFAACLGTLLIVAVAAASTGTTYIYDALGRLTKVINTSTGFITTYAYDAAGNRTQTSSGLDQVLPSVPTGLTGAPHTPTRIDLSWTASSDNVGVAGYHILRGGNQIGTSTSTGYSDLTVVHSTTYTYTVRAYDVAGNVSGPSAPRNVSTPDQTPPSIPSSLSAVAASPSRINLSWSASSDSGGSGLAGYRVYRGPTLLATTAATSYSDTGLAASTLYTYSVAAYDNANNPSSQSSPASATTWSPVSVSLSATTWKWIKRASNPTRIDPSVVCSGSGGSGSGYTYAWQRVSGDTLTVALRPTFPDTRWDRDIPYENNSWTSIWRCLVTDSGGNTGQNTVTVTFTMHTIQ